MKVPICALWILLLTACSITSDPTARAPAGTQALAPVTPVHARSPAAATPTMAPGELATSVAIPFSDLSQGMLSLVNSDRQSNHLSAVAWDGTAASVGQQHAEEMARYGYLSHWDLQGYGPDGRYGLAGGLNAVRENVYTYSYSPPGAGPRTAEAWQKLIQDAEQSLMDSPGHRENILEADHTHLGIGIAWNRQAGFVAIAQEFVNQYVTLQPLPRQVAVGERVSMAGQLGPGASSPLLNLAYEPFPQPMTVGQLENTHTYSSAAETYDAQSFQVDSRGHFQTTVRLDNEGKPGLYHLRIWVDTPSGQTLATDAIVRIGQ